MTANPIRWRTKGGGPDGWSFEEDKEDPTRTEEAGDPMQLVLAHEEKLSFGD